MQHDVARSIDVAIPEVCAAVHWRTPQHVPTQCFLCLTRSRRVKEGHGFQWATTFAAHHVRPVLIYDFHHCDLPECFCKRHDWTWRMAANTLTLPPVTKADTDRRRRRRHQLPRELRDYLLSSTTKEETPAQEGDASVECVQEALASPPIVQSGDELC